MKRSPFWPTVIVAAFILVTARPAAASPWGDWGSGTPTDCVVSGSSITMGAFLGSDYPLTCTKLIVGGEVVQQHNFQPQEWVYTDSVGANWDTSHFDDGDVIEVEARVEDTITSYSITTHLTICNKALCLGNQTFPNGLGAAFAQYVAAHLDGANQNTTYGDDWDADDILAGLPDYTAFCIFTHGADGVIADCFYDPQQQTGDVIGDGDIYDMLTLFPPPAPYNFVFIMACHSADSGSLANAFGIYDEAFNAAFLGFDTVVLINSNAVAYADAIASNLADGMTLEDAMSQAAYVTGKPDAAQNNDHAANPVCIGDADMRLHNAYYGDGSEWYYTWGQ